MKPKVLFFSRDYQADFMVFLTSDRYDSLHATLTIDEKRRIERRGLKVIGCFEEEFEKLPVEPLPDNYLETSFSADRYLRAASMLDRRRILEKEISFWTRILDTYNPDLVVNEIVAIEISEVLYLEARKRNIRYSSWMTHSVKNKFYWQTSPLHNSLDPAIFHSVPDSKSLRTADEYIQKVNDGKGRPFYADNLKSRFNLYNLLKNVYWYIRCQLTENKYGERVKNLLFFGTNAPFYKERIQAFFNSTSFKYNKLEEFESFEKIFYPVHYEPEAILLYCAEFHDNQIASIENFAKCLKHNQVLVVKEHPQQPGIFLKKAYRDARKRLRNVVFLPAEYSTYHIIQQSKLVVTLTSTAGIEALILGKPVVVLGKVYFDQYPNVNRIGTYPALRIFIREERNWNFPEVNSLRNYLAQIIQYCYDGNPFPHNDLYSAANIRNIVSAIEGELKKELKLPVAS